MISKRARRRRDGMCFCYSFPYSDIGRACYVPKYCLFDNVVLDRYYSYYILAARPCGHLKCSLKQNVGCKNHDKLIKHTIRVSAWRSFHLWLCIKVWEF